MPAATVIRERPILMGAPMVRAILSGRKTMTRRVLKVQPLDILTKRPPYANQATRVFNDRRCWFYKDQDNPPRGGMFCCKYGEIGDRLWVREAFSPMQGCRPIPNPEKYDNKPAWYAADNDRPMWAGIKWKPSIHMPREFSRITLEITGVRVERLREITEEDATAEGIRSWQEGYPRGTGEPPVGYDTRYGSDFGWFPTSSPMAVLAFRKLWDKLNGEKFSWATDPFVWVIEFRRITNDPLP